MITRLIQAALHPEPYRVRLLRPLLKRATRLPYELRLQFDAVDRPWYGYGVLNAAKLAKRIGHERMSILELGVAGGNGLVCMENHAEEVARAIGIKIDVIGIDSGEGMPDPVDWRDGGQVWRGGHYKMDVQALRSRLRSGTKLYLGDVGSQIDVMAADGLPGPIGFVALDLDYRSSSLKALRLFDILKPDQILPRAHVWVDDMVHGDPIAGINDHMGVGCALTEFNETHEMQKIMPDRSLDIPRKVRSSWSSRVFIRHDFEHPYYGAYVGEVADDQRPLR